jgi:hypothetical protein
VCSVSIDLEILKKKYEIRKSNLFKKKSSSSGQPSTSC